MVLDKEKQGNILFPRRNMDFTEMFKKANMDGSTPEGHSPQCSWAQFSSTSQCTPYPEEQRVVQSRIAQSFKK